MSLNFGSVIICLFFALSSLTHAESFSSKVGVPPCPPNSQKYFMPDASRPQWVGCKDNNGLYQGLLVQFTSQGEVIRIAGMKNSLRHGREIRFGETNFIEERSYLNGHLTQDSFIYTTDSLLGRIMPQKMAPKDWQSFTDLSVPPVLGTWMKKEPYSVVHFENGRMNRIKFGAKDYQFQIAPEGRIFSVNHPEIKGSPFIDPTPLWNLGSDDLRRAILPGFGSCKKYSGPISRFGRHYDHLLYVRQSNEKKHLQTLSEIRNRFIQFCVPEDLMEHLGVLECPPQLPKMLAPYHCLVPVSDQLKIPYEPKYFKFEYMMGKSPEDFIDLLGREKIMKFLSDADQELISIFIKPSTMVVVKKSLKNVVYRIFKDHPPSVKISGKQLEDKDWWEWHPFPGNE